MYRCIHVCVCMYACAHLLVYWCRWRFYSLKYRVVKQLLSHGQPMALSQYQPHLNTIDPVCLVLSLSQTQTVLLGLLIFPQPQSPSTLPSTYFCTPLACALSPPAQQLTADAQPPCPLASLPWAAWQAAATSVFPTQQYTVCVRLARASRELITAPVHPAPVAWRWESPHCAPSRASEPILPFPPQALPPHFHSGPQLPPHMATASWSLTQIPGGPLMGGSPSSQHPQLLYYWS